MLTVDDALQRILEETPIQPVESVSLDKAAGRVLAEDVTAVLDVPRWDTSAMDGYAVRAADTSEDEVTLALNEVVGAGMVARKPVAPGTCTGVMTGAPIPEGADAVVMIEDTDGSRRERVRIRGRVSPGRHIRRRGEDIRKGDRLLPAGRRLTPGDLGLIASQGVTSVLVSRRPVVSILTTGDEVVEPGRALGPGQIYSTNNAVLGAMIEAAGGVVVDAGNAVDDVHSIVTRLQWCVTEADIVVTTGGVSVGAYDDVKRAFDLLGARIDFWKVAMKPGKPLAFGAVEVTGRRVPLFGLPGNPVSCAVGFLQFVRPMILSAMGYARPYLPVVTALCGTDVRVRPGRAKFIRVSLEQTDSGWVCRPLPNQSSGAVTSLAGAHGLLLVPADSEGFAEGRKVRVQLLDTGFLDRRDPGFGW